MSTIATLIQSFEFNRARTLATLDEIEKLPNPSAALAHRLAPGRAHVAWQFAHVGVVEDVFAHYLVPSQASRLEQVRPRFTAGSTADDNVPDLAQLREILAEGRASLLDALKQFDEGQLNEVPPQLADKKWTLLMLLHIVGWHESHHQGQAHATLNAFKANHL